MYMTNEGWEQNNQDYLKESYEKTGFTAGGYAVRKLICGGCGRIFYTTIETKKHCHSYWCGNQANNRRQREYCQMHRQDLVCQCCGEKFTPKRAGTRYCSNACRQKDYRKRVTNLTLDEIRHPQDTAHARIYDRLLEMCIPISCIGVSFCKETAQEKLERMKLLIG